MGMVADEEEASMVVADGSPVMFPAGVCRWKLDPPSGVAAGRELRVPVRTYDTAATVAYLLDLKPPDCWIGRPVKEAFGK